MLLVKFFTFLYAQLLCSTLEVRFEIQFIMSCHQKKEKYIYLLILNIKNYFIYFIYRCVY